MAGIIKADGSHTPSGGDAIAFRFDDITQKSEEFLDAARKQASEILEQAKSAADRIERQAEVQGQQQAIEQAKRDLSSQLDQHLASLLPALQQATEEVRHSRIEWQHRWQQGVVQLAVAIAAKVIRREVEQQPEITSDLVREALEYATGADQIRLHLAPTDLETLQPSLELVISQLQGLGQVSLVPDESVEPGGCRLTTEYGVVDQQFSAQLARISQELNA